LSKIIDVSGINSVHIIKGIALGTEIVPETLVGVALGHYPDDWDTDGP
jgi:hypothetical protein